jgi:hypothetical protein
MRGTGYRDGDLHRTGLGLPNPPPSRPGAAQSTEPGLGLHSPPNRVADAAGLDLLGWWVMSTSARVWLPGERLMRVGGLITIIGMAFGLIALVPLISGEELPSWLWWMAMSSGIGLALVLLGLHRAAAARRAEIARAAAVRREPLDGG